MWDNLPPHHMTHSLTEQGAVEKCVKEFKLHLSVYRMLIVITV